MPIAEEITKEFLRQIFSYDPETGILSRRERRGRRGKIGLAVGTPDHKGYLRVGLNGKNPFVHRLIWIYVYGHEPIDQIDHINGIKHDNRLANLREATPSQNKCNTPVRRDSESRIKGVTQDKRTGRWRAHITVNGVRRWLGFWATMEEAAAARAAAGNEFHGGFAKETCH